MKIANISVERPVAISMLILAIVFLGIYSLPNLGVALMPNMSIPMVTISTSYQGAAPAEVEKVITKTIESAVSSVSGVTEISSTSSTGISMVMVEFNYGTDIDSKMNDLRSKVDSIRKSLPDDAGSPTISKMDPNSQAIMTYSLSGASLTTMKKIADNTIEPALERLEGVSSVSISGGKDREIQVRLNQAKMQAYGLTIQQVSQAISSDDITGTAGSLIKGSSEISIRVMNEFDSLDIIKNVQISVPDSAFNYVSLSDIADVVDSFKDDSTLTIVNGEPSLSLEVMKTSDGNTVQVAKKVREEIAKLNNTLSSDVQINLVSDTSSTINETIQSVEEHGLLGGIIAVFVLFLFLRSPRSTIVVAITLPVALIATFSAMYYSNVTINMFSLGGLMLGLGSLVDFSIVVLESIYRKRQEGLDVVNAAKVGTSEVGTAVMASAASQIVVFMPVVFVSGIASMIFKPLALTVSFSHACALLAALTLVPMMSSRLLKKVPAPEDIVYVKGTKNPVTIFGYCLQKLNTVYHKILHWALDNRKKVVVCTVLLFFGSLCCIPFIGMEFMNSMDERGVNITVEMPVGTNLEVMKKKAEEIDALAKKVLGSGFKNDYITVGGGSSFMGTSEANKATIKYKLKSTDQYSLTASEAANEVRLALTDVVGTTIKVEVESGAMGMSSTAVDVIIRGGNLDTLTELGNNAAEIIRGISGTKNVANSLSSNTQVQVVVDREKAVRYGLSASKILTEIKTAFGGTQVGTLHTGDNTVDITMKVHSDSLKTENSLSSLLLVSSTGAKVPVSDVASITTKSSPKEISRSNQTREVEITADVDGKDTRTINSEVQTKLANLSLPNGYSISYSGDQKNMNESFASLGMALLLAILLVFMVMAAQFESLFQPFIIMFSLPPTFIGALLGLMITGTSLSVMSLIGVIMLVGIVLNNAIVLVDYINTLRKRGIERNEAILQAGPIRLRPILMTTLCTVMALMPMALGGGSGNEMMKPMAIVIAFGLSFSTLITLVLVPVVYTIFDDLTKKIINYFGSIFVFLQTKMSRSI